MNIIKSGKSNAGKVRFLCKCECEFEESVKMCYKRMDRSPITSEGFETHFAYACPECGDFVINKGGALCLQKTETNDINE